MARADDIMKAAGALRCRGWATGPRRLAPDGHGTDGQRSAASVVNAWGRSHDVRNLFIVDGSIFITSAGVNPTHTIQALALYIADQIKQRLGTLFD